MGHVAETIVVGIDGSSSWDQTLAWSVEQAVAENRAITLVHAVPRTTPAWLDPAGSNPREAHDLALREMGQAVLDHARDAVHRIATGVTVHQECRLEDPREVLVELSGTAYIIVLGSRGRGLMRSLLLGSTAVIALSESLAGFGEQYPDVTVHTEIDQGMPERYLLRLADQMNMLVVGAHHGSLAEQFMFGSVSVWLVERATCPVAVISLSAARTSAAEEA